MGCNGKMKVGKENHRISVLVKITDEDSIL
jgi:hypothetical protein